MATIFRLRDAAVDGTSALIVDLFAGQQVVVVVVDGYGTGSFVLDVQ